MMSDSSDKACTLCGFDDSLDIMAQAESGKWQHDTCANLHTVLADWLYEQHDNGKGRLIR